ncbi:L-serine ammonia-lyase, iron-sulfur-dependent, subunit alpha [Kineothrix sedimenti]|uniref:L-serine ammonia-lyase n=1 Tax=Kineothrix sedimenti TaxID=3123317 RepID=A0ABZ3F1W0_9FIRM
MLELYPDFYNDVFGPIMQPGSSSHTAGPCRIGYVASCLLDAPLKQIQVYLDPDGSFAGTFGWMNEDLGMLAGAYGFLPEEEKIFDIRQILSEEGIPYRFDFEKIAESSHPNAVKFVLTDRNDEQAVLVGNSIGGGMIEVVWAMGIPISFKGDKELVLQGNRRQYVLKPILPVITTERKKPQLFADFEEWIRISEVNHQSLWETALVYEENSSGWGRGEIVEYMRKIQRLLKRQTDYIDEAQEQLLETPFSGYHFRKWENYCKQSPPAVGGVITNALTYSYRAQAFRRGVQIVPGPMGTGGGYLYSAVRAVMEARHLSEEDVLHGLFVAAGVGVICYTRSEPTGETTGCAGECGVCSAMAAAAITEMSSGTPSQVESAASLALQAAIGWPCDPIPGGNNQPCFSRFTTAITMAITFSDLALSGREGVIPFHEVVDVMDSVGREMPAGLKCTAQGGLCASPEAAECKRRFISATGLI